MVDDADLFRTAWRHTGTELLRHLRCVCYSDTLSPRHRWYCAQLNPGCDFLAAMLMVRRGTTIFLPLMQAETATGPQIDPLFPGYVFAAVDHQSEALMARVRVNGFKQLLDGGRPLRPGIVEALIDQAGPDRIIRAHRPDANESLHHGETIRFTGGPFADLTGIVDLPGKQRVRVLLAALAGQMAVEVPRSMLERIPG